ncbi:MAG: cysteine desulfurase family protein [Bacteroidota bacterium]|nr:cysteine desulfurase family protein [Bacteroidota bacterium]MDP4225120.1 cysteine desulfurase family protein [Bacteroidota bacterium]MDP4273166.1 cysteine desulfurase family protein [Bacteroidota bacterium]
MSENKMANKVYLDNAATTRVDDRVLAEMLPYFSDTCGNASSLHSFGTKAKEALDKARQTIASSINALPEEIVFTSGGTEANNFALKGIAFANRGKGNHIIVSSIEHDCILHSCQWLEDQGFYVTYLDVDNEGRVNPDELEKVINPKTILVSVMHANNEIGTIQPIDEIAAICKAHQVYFHSDACQSYGKIPIDVNKTGIDLLTINAHKIYGPKGVGALYIRKGVKINPLLHGGGQEGGFRSTTENIPGIIGFAKAVELCMAEIGEEPERQRKLRDKLANFLSDNFEDVYINGPTGNRLCGHLNFSFHGMEGETIRLLLLLDEQGIAVSAGSACSSNDQTHSASHVLQAIGLNQFEARGGIRISLGRFTTSEDIDSFCNALKQIVKQLNPIFSKL